MINSIHQSKWSKLEVTDRPTGRHGVYDSTEADKFAPQQLGSAVAASVASSIAPSVSAAIGDLEARRSAMSPSPKSSPAPTSFKDKQKMFESASSSSSALSPSPAPPAPSYRPVVGPSVSSPPASSLSSPPLSRSIGASTGEALNHPDTWLKAGSQVREGGRCFSLAARVVYDLVKAGVVRRIEVFGSSRYDHYFVVVGRPASSTTSIDTWDKNTIIVDAWAANAEKKPSPCYHASSYTYRSGLKLVCSIQ